MVADVLPNDGDEYSDQRGFGIAQPFPLPALQAKHTKEAVEQAIRRVIDLFPQFCNDDR